MGKDGRDGAGVERIGIPLFLFASASVLLLLLRMHGWFGVWAGSLIAASWFDAMRI